MAPGQGITTSEQYDLSPEEIRKVKERAKLRAEFRAEFVKQFTNPHRHGQGGYIFDPAMQRWQSMTAQHYYYFKPTAKSFIAPFIVISSIIAYSTLLHKRHTKREKSYRSGEVSYRDREFKFV